MSPPVDPLAERLHDAPARRILALAAGAVAAPLVAILVLVTIATATRPYSPLSPPLHQATVGLAMVLALYEAGRRAVLRAPATWYQAGRPSRQVLGWAAVGMGLPIAVLGLQLGLLGATATGGQPTLGRAVEYVVASLAAGLLAGVLEELAFRGVLLRVIEVRWGPGRAVAASAAVFALLHHGRANGPLELALVLAAMFAAGLLLGVVVVRTRSVWNAVAVHAGWNTVFGGQVVTVASPDVAPGAALLQYRLPAHSTVLTGGEATLGAAPLTTALLLAAMLVVARVCRPGRAGPLLPTRPAGREED